MIKDSIRFFLQDGRICVRGGELDEIIDLGPDDIVGEAMVSFFEERTAMAEQNLTVPPSEPVQTSAASLIEASAERPATTELPAEPSGSASRGKVIRSEERHDLTIRGRIVTKSGPRDVTVLDLSESGCRFADRYHGLLAGNEISIKIGPIGPIRATARWCRDGFVGIAFETPLYPSVLEHIRNHFK